MTDLLKTLETFSDDFLLGLAFFILMALCIISTFFPIIVIKNKKNEK